MNNKLVPLTDTAVETLMLLHFPDASALPEKDSMLLSYRDAPEAAQEIGDQVDEVLVGIPQEERKTKYIVKDRDSHLVPPVGFEKIMELCNVENSTEQLMNEKVILEKMFLRMTEIMDDILAHMDQMNWDNVQNQDINYLRNLSKEFQWLFSFLEKISCEEKCSQNFKIIIDVIVHDFLSWAFSLRSSCGTYLASPHNRNEAIKNIKSIKPTIMTYKCLINTYLLTMGKPEKVEPLDNEALIDCLKTEGERFDYEINVCDELEQIVTEGPVLNFYCDPKAKGKIKTFGNSLVGGVFQAIKNALKIIDNMEYEGEKLGEDRKPITLRIDYDEKSKECEISILDLGIGISYDQLRDNLSKEAEYRVALGKDALPIDYRLANSVIRNHIPPPFYELFLSERGRSLDKNGGGSGLGAHIMHVLAQEHGGYVRISNQAGEGAKVMFVFPEKQWEAVDPNFARNSQVRRFNLACEELKEAELKGHTLYTRFYSDSKQGWIEVYRELGPGEITNEVESRRKEIARVGISDSTEWWREMAA